MRRSSLVAIIILIILVAAAAVAIGHKSNTNTNNSQASTNNTQPKAKTSSTGQNSNTQSTANTVNIANMAFTPSQITVNKGDTVTWTNNDSTTHTVIDDLSNVGGPSSGDIQPGSSYSFTFTKTGSFQYHCQIHPSMRGTIVVK
jgi:plastocyanin